LVNFCFDFDPSPTFLFFDVDLSPTFVFFGVILFFLVLVSLKQV